MKNTFKIMAIGSLLAVGSTQAATQVIISSFTGTSGDPSSVYEAANWSPTGVPGENPSSGEYYVAIVDNQFSTTGSVGGGSVNTFTGNDVWGVLVRGEWVTKERKLVNVDVEKVMERAHKVVNRLWERMLSMEPKYKIEYLKP